MKQVILKKQETLVLCDNEKRIICKDDEVVIQVKAVTICGSDISYFKADTLPHQLTYPLILAHEAAGIITQIGRDVKHLQMGDRVAIEPDQYCGHCEYCRSGHYNFCESLRFMASKGEEGALQEYVSWPAQSVYKIHDSMSYEDGALLEPLSVAYSAIEKMNLKPDARLAILGAGSIGILTALLIQILYPDTKFYLIDLYEEKKQLGIQAGIAEEHFLIGTSYDLNAMKPFTHLMDASGAAPLIHTFLKHSIQGVRLVCVGVSDQNLNLTCKDVVYKGIELIGSYRYEHTYPKLLKLFEQGMLDMNHVITSRYTMRESQKAFEAAADTKHNIKVAITIE